MSQARVQELETAFRFEVSYFEGDWQKISNEEAMILIQDWFNDIDSVLDALLDGNYVGSDEALFRLVN